MRRTRWKMRLLGLAALFALAASVPAQTEEPQADAVTASVEISRPNVYVNEPFELTLIVEAMGVQLAQSMQLQSGPEKDHLALGEFDTLPEERSIRNGKVFIRRQFRCTARATRPGDITIAPTLLIHRLERARAFIGTAWRETPQVLRTPETTLRARPIPDENRPPNWSGAIGRFELRVEATPTTVAPGDLVTLRSELTGSGYTEGMQPPAVVATASRFKTYPPKPVPGSADAHVFTQIVIPQSTNAVAAPPVRFCFFDPVRETFVTLEKGPFPLQFRSKTVQTEERFTPDETGRVAERPTATAQSARDSVRRGVLALGLGLTVLCGAAAVINAMRKRRRRTLLWLCGAALTIAAMWVLNASEIWNPPAFTLTRDTAARLAPSRTAMVCSELAKGAEVSILEHDGAWLCVRDKDRGGWIPADAVEDR